jgi:hypothetical protein
MRKEADAERSGARFSISRGTAVTAALLAIGSLGGLGLRRAGKRRGPWRRGLGVRAGLLAVVAASVLLASGCGDDDEPADAPSESPTRMMSTPAANPPVDPEHVPVLDAYQAFVRSAAEAFNRGDPDYPALAEHADGPALVRTRAAIEQHAANGRVYQGSPVIDTAQVTQLDPDAPPEEPNAEVLACVDVSDYVLVYEADGSPVPVERGLERYQATAELWHTDDGRWLVVGVEELRETPC